MLRNTNISIAKIAILAVILILISTGLENRTARIVGAEGPQQQSPLCDLPGLGEGELFKEIWIGTAELPNEDWEITAGDWENPNPIAAGRMRQNDNTPNQINIAYELPTDVADGTIHTCMQLLDPPTSDSPIPHGIVFRY